MQRVPAVTRPYAPVNPDNFVLPAVMQPLLGRDDHLPVRLYRVSFEAGSRTHWHRHDGIQVLFGLSGTCVVVDRGGLELRLDPGDAVIIDPGEEHWHGAVAGGIGEHLAINLGSSTEWLEPSG